MYHLFEHTADLGLRVRAATLPELFADAGRGLFSMIVENLERIRPDHRHQVNLEAETTADLLFDWLSELLFLFDARHQLFGRFEVRLPEPTRLEAVALGEPLDRDRHQLDHEVKAITYHGLRCEPTDHGWLAEVIVDI